MLADFASPANTILLKPPRPDLIEPISRMAQVLSLELRDTRRHLHAHPELGWEEAKTTIFMAQRLAALGYAVRSGPEVIGEDQVLGVGPGGPKHTGCIAERIFGTGPTVAIRADLDALPILEAETEHIPAQQGWASRHTGVMHACGHDGHLAIALGAAQILSHHAEKLRGRLRIILQPAEEGTRGARAIVDQGWLDDVDLFFGYHIGLGVPSHTLAVDPVGFLATRKYHVSYTGLPAHAGRAPEEGRNALLAACQAILGLHALAQSGKPGIRVNVGTMQAGQGMNIVPDQARFGLELRAGRDIDLKTVEARMHELIAGLAQAYELKHDIRLAGEASDWENSRPIADWADGIARMAGVFEQRAPGYDVRVSEDATLMAHAVRRRGGLASYFVLGADLSSGHHTAEFDFDEAVLAEGTAFIASLAASGLARD